MDHVCGAPNQPQTQGKIERWHQTLKNHILLENYYLEGELEAAIDPSAHSSITSIHRAEALQTKITPPVPNHSTTDKTAGYLGHISYIENFAFAMRYLASRMQ